VSAHSRKEEFEKGSFIQGGSMNDGDYWNLIFDILTFSELFIGFFLIQKFQ
jgi:hypothetical protein